MGAERVIRPEDEAWHEPCPDEPITVKWGAPIPLSTEIALAAGIITQEQAVAQGWTPPPPVPRLRRWRYALELWEGKRPTLHFGPCERL